MWFRDYVSVGERAARARRKIVQLQKKKKDINPVVIEGNKIANSWWGKAWINHLESYADYDNRVPRGRSYVKNGLVIHLSIKEGEIESMVMGTGSQPYKITISMKKISKKKWDHIKELSRKNISTLSDLLTGNLPKELAQVFSDCNEGIFPTLREISFDCSCPDWASMCKHVSAALYALGSRLDKEISLFFQLRGVDIQDLVQSVVQSESTHLQQIVPTHSAETLELADSKLAQLFNIKLSVPPKKKRQRKKRTVH